MIFSVSLCIASFVLLVMLLRKSGISLGLPIAYLFSLLFNHVPGAVAHILGSPELTPTQYTETGIWFTAVGSVAFLVGVGVVHLGHGKQVLPSQPAHRQDFAKFCLVGGLLVTYALSFITVLTSVGMIVLQAGSIWIFGTLIGLREALRRGTLIQTTFWVAAMAIYPVMTLVGAGFLSFGSTPVFVILSGLVISTRKTWRVVVGIAAATFVFFHLFLSYFANRTDIRDAVWGGANLEIRIKQSAKMFTEIEFFSREKSHQMRALDARLNQNYFCGLAAEWIDARVVHFLYGRSINEGLLSLVPRILWPDKPSYGGSYGIITEMTGFEVNDTTTFGVGHVMEFYINFGIPSLIGGFLLLGLLFGWLDRRAALAERSGDLGLAIVYFLPLVAMNMPLGSLAELTGSGLSSYLAALGWCWIWGKWSASKDARKGHVDDRENRIAQAGK